MLDPTAVLDLSGTIVGSLQLSGPKSLGPVQLWPDHDEIRFRLVWSAPEQPQDDPQVMVDRAVLAVEAAVAAATQSSIEVHPSGWSYDSSAGRKVGVVVRASYTVFASVTDDGAVRGATAAASVLEGPDERLPELYEVYLLGLRGMQTATPLLGFWAFSTVLEEEVPKGKTNLDHVPELAERLRELGYDVLPLDPGWPPSRIRAAALHPTPKDPLPTREHVEWFRQVAHAYLLQRATERRPARSQRTALR